MLKHLTKVKIEFNAMDPRASSALEFLAQCSTKSSKASNPKCDVQVKRRTDDATPSVTVTYANGKEDTLDGSQLTARDIRKAILKKADEMETEAMFKEAGIPWPVIIPIEEVEMAKKLPFKFIKENVRIT